MARAKPKPGADRAGSIYRALRHAIIEQALEPGAKLPEDAIGERFGASRTIVRARARAARGRGPGRTAPQSRRRGRDSRAGRRRAIPSTCALGLERLVMSRLAGRLTRSRSSALEAHVDRKNGRAATTSRYRSALRPNSISCWRKMTGSPVLARYVSEVVLALRPHPCALQPSAFIGMRRERASRGHCGSGGGRRRARVRADGRASRGRCRAAR